MDEKRWLPLISCEALIPLPSFPFTQALASDSSVTYACAIIQRTDLSETEVRRRLAEVQVLVPNIYPRLTRMKLEILVMLTVRLLAGFVGLFLLPKPATLDKSIHGFMQ